MEFGYTEYGRPFLKPPNTIDFNVSHSGKKAVFALVREVEIGVDIERIKSDFEVMEVAQNFFSSDEIQKLSALPDHRKVAGFYRCWTRKEAFIKAKGSGLSFPLTSFSVSLDMDNAELLRTDWDAVEKGEWRMFSFQPEEGYLGAISIRGGISEVSQMDWNAIHT